MTITTFFEAAEAITGTNPFTDVRVSVRRLHSGDPPEYDYTCSTQNESGQLLHTKICSNPEDALIALKEIVTRRTEINLVLS